MKRSCLLIFIFCNIISFPSISQAVIAQGVGASRASALNSAFRQAVEDAAGTFIESRTVVECGELVKDEIVSHARGYVSEYTLLNEKKESDGTYLLEIDATVDNGLINQHVEALEILMTMTGHHKVVIFGIDDDMHSISSIIDEFVPLRETVEKVFHEKFRFDVMDWATLRAKHPEVSGKLDRNAAIRFAKRVGADLAVMVKLNAEPKPGRIEGSAYSRGGSTLGCLFSRQGSRCFQDIPSAQQGNPKDYSIHQRGKRERFRYLCVVGPKNGGRLAAGSRSAKGIAVFHHVYRFSPGNG